MDKAFPSKGLRTTHPRESTVEGMPVQPKRRVYRPARALGDGEI